ncbi:hypothetical protein XELAEV_18001096mg [Xenopus laevis]|uniref:GIY-YIG domain-containing protein n=1 Tax=Xenopus laevis TaxID=8355 RepID=A0A974BPM8_XENLA|nr:hypothetical protein XELAEV_18001096mg [Xenopus laevis]
MSIPHSLGIETIRNVFERIHQPLSEEHSFILKALSFVLHHNVFIFNGVYYLQRQGVAMGAKCAPSYANLFLGEWERHGPERKLKLFVVKLNRNSFNLTFTMNYHYSRLEFLDIEIKKDERGQLSTNLFRKKTAGNSLLHAESMHPPKCIEGIPKGQYLRLRRICSTEEDFKREAYQLYLRFKARGYKTRSLRRAYQFAFSRSRDEVLYKHQQCDTSSVRRKDEDRTRFILTYGMKDQEARAVIQKHWHILSSDPNIGKWVTTRPLFGYRRNNSIGDLLTHSHFQKYSGASCCKTPGSYRCGACDQCQYIKISREFGNRNAKYNMYHYTSCTTIHVIYLFTCHCGSKYVGKTKRPLKRRIYEHMRDINNCNLLSSIAKHIYCIHNGEHRGSYFQGIDRLHGDIRGGDLDNKLLQMETSWIFKLNTYKSEYGLNGQLNFQAFINK